MCIRDRAHDRVCGNGLAGTGLAHDAQHVALVHRKGNAVQCLEDVYKRQIPHRECHIQPDWLLIYYQTDTELYLYRTGTHADLFGL